MNSFLRQLSHKSRQAHRYNAFIAARLDHVLRSGSIPAKIVNIGLWLAFHGVRVARQIRYRQWSLRSSQTASQGSVHERPWLLPVTDNPVRRGVLIVAELSIPQCRQYRVEQKVTMFRHLGQPATVVSWTDSATAFSQLQTSLLLVCYRTPATQEMKDLVQEASRLSIPVLFDIDDLVFDVEAYSLNSNLRQLPKSEQKQLLEGAQLYCDMLSLSDHAIASTRVLKDHMKPFQDGSLFIVENGLENSLCQIAEEDDGFPDKDRVVIGYGSGTRTHDSDFAEVTEALTRVLSEHPDVELAIFGHLTIPEALNGFKDRIRRVPFIRSEDYYRALRQFDINLAPLEAGVFNDAKSNIKYLEASVLGIPSVASPRDTFSDIIRHGENGYLADTSDDWYEALSTLVKDSGTRQKIGKAARETVLARYPLTTIAEQQLAPVLELAGNAHEGESTYHIMVVNVLFAPLSFGGATIVAEQMAKDINKREDTRVTVVTGCFNGTLAPGEIRQYQWEGISVFAIGLIGGDKETDFSNPLADECFETIVSALRPDAVHFHSIQMLGAGLTGVCRQFNIPYAITLHDAWWLCERQFMVNENGYCGQEAIDPLVCASCVEDPSLTYRRRFILQDALHHAALLLSPSDFQALLHVRSGCPSEKVVVNKNGVLAPDENYPALVAKRDSKPLVFAYMGGVADHKGYPWLKRLFESLDRNDYVLRLVDIQARFGRATIRREDWDIQGDIDIVAPFSTQDMDEFYADIDVLLFPSQWKESFGLTVREAMIRDVWVIATECGGPSEDLKPGINGDVVDMNDSAGFVQSITDCLNDPERIRAYRNPLASQIRTFPQQADELHGLLINTIEGSRSVIATDA
ncbi:glycosyltransferase [Kushneria sp. Sum13]|uniref:glycosyltransferase n=1 Tax=Kushneria sp. Sum13 TaxID=3459196 RepID=UPI0040454027